VNRRTGFQRTWRRARLALAGGAAALLAGCASLSQDIDQFTKAILPPKPGEAARWMFDQHDPDQRRQGMVLISNAPFGGSEVYVRAYRDMVREDRDPGVRAAAIRALARWGAPEDATLIAVHLHDSNVHVRREAAAGLQRLHFRTVVPAMLRVMRTETEDADVRQALAVALGQYQEDRVVQGLIAALDAPELTVNLAAHQSLVTLTGQDHGLDQRAWLNWYAQSREPFSGGREYLYPTYQRRSTWMEYLAFWTRKSWEQPGVPAGLRPLAQRSTYGPEEQRQP
jgi:hypothetical protein